MARLFQSFRYLKYASGTRPYIRYYFLIKSSYGIIRSVKVCDSETNISYLFVACLKASYDIEH